MNSVEIIGYKRANLGKINSKQLRAEGNVPCVLYGGEEQIHFHAPMYLFRPLVYTQEAHFVTINVEGTEYKGILQDIQFHPVSEMILHADFLQLFEDRSIKMDIPVVPEGSSPGVAKGGNMLLKKRKLSIKSLPKDMPSTIKVDISSLDFGKTVKVNEVTPDGYEILNNPMTTIASVEIPRSLRSTMDGEEGEEGEEGGEESGDSAE